MANLNNDDLFLVGRGSDSYTIEYEDLQENLRPTYTYPGSGVEQTVQQRLEQYVSVKDFGAVGDGITDDTAAIEAALLYIFNNGESADNQLITAKTTLDFAGKSYLIKEPLSLTKTAALTNGTLLAASDYSGTNAMLTVYPAAEGSHINNFQFDGGLNGTVMTAPCLDIRADRVYVNDVNAYHFKTFGIKIQNAQECILNNIILREWGYSEAGTTDKSLRKATCLDIQSNDNILSKVVAAQSLLNLNITAGGTMLDTCHFYNGGATDPTGVKCCTISGNDNTFTNCYFDNGNVVLTEFMNQFTGCLFYTSNTSCNLVLVSSEDEEKCSGLSVSNCNWGGPLADNAELVFDDSTNTFAELDFIRIYWVNNNKANGLPVWKVRSTVNTKEDLYEKTNVSEDAVPFTYNCTQGMVFHANYNNSDDSGENNKIIFKTSTNTGFLIEGNNFCKADETKYTALGKTDNPFSKLNVEIVDFHTPLESSAGAEAGYFEIQVNGSKYRVKLYNKE